MAHWETLMARDGHEFAAYLARPAGTVRGGVVVLQEIFGVNAHIREVTERFAAAGYLSIAPALFDRVGRNLELGYSAEEIPQARGYMMQIPADSALRDVAAAVAVIRHAGKVALLGYCWGGLLAWLGARQLPVQAAVSYYPGRIGQHLEALPTCPMQLHFGEQDSHIPLAEVERARQAFAAGQFHLYAAGHGFACDQRSSFEPISAALATERTLAFLHQHLG